MEEQKGARHNAVLDDLSGGGVLSAEAVWEVGAFEVVKTETWDEAGATIQIDWLLKNVSEGTMTDLRLLWAVDPDQGVGFDEEYGTFIDNIDAHDAMELTVRTFVRKDGQ